MVTETVIQSTTKYTRRVNEIVWHKRDDWNSRLMLMDGEVFFYVYI